MTAKIIDINVKRTGSKSMPVKADMTANQYTKRQLMERGDWLFKKVIKSGDVVMTFGEPVEKMAFIEPCGHVESYNYSEA